MPETFIVNCGCFPAPGTTPPDIAPYVVSIGGLDGIVTLDGQGAIDITTSGNTILFSLSASAGLGTVTQVAASSSSTNLVIGGTPINAAGTLTFALAGNIGSIAGLVMAADQMLYSTAADTFAATSLTAFGRSLIDDATAVNARSTLGLVIGTNVQAWSADLDRLVTDWSFSVSDWTLTGTLTISGDLTAGGVITFTDVVTIGDALSVGNGLSVTGTTTSTLFSGSGASLINLNASNLSSGTAAVARGGTGIASYAVGDLLYASGATTLAKLADVAVGSMLRSGGVGVAPAWSQTLWPNNLTTGDILYASSTTQVSRLANVATGNVLLSGGVGTASTFGKVTSSHVDSTIPTMSAGINADITGFFNPIAFQDALTLSSDIHILGGLYDSSDSIGSAGNVLVSTGSGTEWSTGISVNTLSLNTSFSMEATITAGGVTGNQTINKPLGSVNIAAGGSSITVTNSLVDANSCVFCQIATNDSTAIIKNVVASSGQFVIRTTAAVTAETRINFQVILPI